jgi:hypothetical protein
MLFNVRRPGTSSLATFARPPGGNRNNSLPTRDCVPGYVRSPYGQKQELFIHCLPGTSSLATFVRPPGGNRCCSMSAYQGLRPWLRSLALRAKTETIHCPPGTTFHTLCEGTGHVPPPSALRAGIDVVQCPPTRDFVPGYVRTPSGREEDGDLAPQPTSIPLRPEGG